MTLADLFYISDEPPPKKEKDKGYQLLQKQAVIVVSDVNSHHVLWGAEHRHQPKRMKPSGISVTP
jgi:hypothetical protein